MHLKNLRNNYMAAAGSEFFEKTPKAVWAALAVSFAAMTVESAEEFLENPGAVAETLAGEWAILYRAGIVPQSPPKKDHEAKGGSK